LFFVGLASPLKEFVGPLVKVKDGAIDFRQHSLKFRVALKCLLVAIKAGKSASDIRICI
jgi:hypothetical protein